MNRSSAGNEGKSINDHLAPSRLKGDRVHQGKECNERKACGLFGGRKKRNVNYRSYKSYKTYTIPANRREMIFQVLFVTETSSPPLWSVIDRASPGETAAESVTTAPVADFAVML